MRIAVIHPLKHHVYYSMAGIMESEAEVLGLFGYYDKNDFIDKILRKTKWKKQMDGYKYEKISEHVKTNAIVKIFFLLAKAQPQIFQKIYDFAFKIWVIYNLKDIDCIHVLQDYENEVIRFAQKKNLKIIYEQITAYHMERYFDENVVKLEDMLQKENLKIADYILTPSKFVKNSIEEIEGNEYITEKIVTIPYGANVQQFRHQVKMLEKGQALNLLIVASVSQGKGMKYLFDAMKKLRDYPVKLSVIGATVTEEKNLINKMKDLDNVKYIGKVPHEQINRYFNKNHIFILPSLAEGSSLSVYEALAAGLPCIVTENTGSVVSDGIDGIIIKARSVESIVNAIRRFIENPELVQKMSCNTKTTIMKYTWDEYEKKIAAFYKKSVISDRISKIR